jgi:hypothetical protein
MRGGNHEFHHEVLAHCRFENTCIFVDGRSVSGIGLLLPGML